MSDDFTLDFSDTEAMGKGFDPLPAGWYPVTVVDWEQDEVGETAKKLEPGTLGTRYELDIDEGSYDVDKYGPNRKFWANFWHAKSSFGFWKGFLEATGTFSAEELESAGLDLNEARERPQGAKLQVHVKLRNDKQYGKSNQINGYKRLGDDTSEDPSSFLPT